MLSSSDQSHGPWRGAEPNYSRVNKLNVPFKCARPTCLCVMLLNRVWSWPDLCTGTSRRDLTCVWGCWSPAHAKKAAPSAASGCWSTGRGLWRWWPFGWSPTPAHTRWNSGWRKYCALPAMRNKEIDKKAKAPLMRRSAQLGCNSSEGRCPDSRSWKFHKRALKYLHCAVPSMHRQTACLCVQIRTNGKLCFVYLEKD